MCVSRAMGSESEQACALGGRQLALERVVSRLQLRKLGH
jgi:hypothetical protein